MTFTDEDIEQIADIIARVASDEGLVREIAEGRISEPVLDYLLGKMCVASPQEIDRMRRAVAGRCLASGDPAQWEVARTINDEIVGREGAQSG
jgi:hypothetical protein